jgi:hypothetical protein
MIASSNPHPHAYSSFLQITVETLRLLAMSQSALLQLPGFRIPPYNLLKARVIVTTKAYSRVGAGIVMESITLRTPSQGSVSEIEILRQQSASQSGLAG